MARSEGANVRKARGIWTRAANATLEIKSYVRVYLEGRGIKLEDHPDGTLPGTLSCVEDLEFGYYATAEAGGAWVDDEPGPAMVAGVVFGRTFKGVHTTYLACSDGLRVTKRAAPAGASVKKMLGDMAGGYVPLSEPSDLRTLILTEGIETGLAVACATQAEVWAVLSTSGLRTLNIPKARARDFDRIVIAADSDPSGAGEQAAWACAVSLAAAHPKVEIIISVARHPRQYAELVNREPIERKGLDWLDVWQDVQGYRAEEDIYAKLVDSVRREILTGTIAHAGKRKGGQIMPESDSDRARLHLEQCWSPTPGQDGEEGSRWRLAYLRGVWHRWDGSTWQVMDDISIRWAVREWARDFVVETKNAEVEFTPSNNAIEGIIKAIMDEVAIERPTSRRCWLAPSIDPDGEPVWGVAPWQREVRDAAAHGLPDPDRIIPMPAGLLDLDAWLDGAMMRRGGELRLLPATPRYVNTTAIDIDLDWDAARDAWAEGEEAYIRHAASMCPEVVALLQHAFRADERPEQYRPTVRELWKHLGYMLTPDTSHQEGSICVLHGPSGTGKSTIEKLFVEMLGAANCISTSVANVQERAHIAAFRGKQMAYIPDYEQPERADARRLVEFLKVTTGGSDVATRDLYEKEVPGERFDVRWLIVTNVMPDLPDASGALMRRVKVFDINRPVETVDRSLPDKIGSAESRRGLLLMALLGRRWLAEDGEFIQCESGKGPLRILEGRVAPLQRFIDDFLEVRAGLDVTDTRLLDAYQAFCKIEGITWTGTRSKLVAELYPLLGKDPEYAGAPLTMDGFRGLTGVGVNETALALAKGETYDASGADDVADDPGVPV